WTAREIKTSTTARRKSGCWRGGPNGCGSTSTRRTAATWYSKRPPTASTIPSGLNSNTHDSSASRSRSRAGWSTASCIPSSCSGPHVTRNDLPFDEVWGFDCEFITKPGERPDVLSTAGCELWSGRSFALWEDELESLPSFGATALVLSFVANAE